MELLLVIHQRARADCMVLISRMLLGTFRCQPVRESVEISRESPSLSLNKAKEDNFLYSSVVLFQPITFSSFIIANHMAEPFKSFSE